LVKAQRADAADPHDRGLRRLHAPPEETFGRLRRTSLRFYFANQVLANGAADHHGISRHMVALTTYLGHRDVRNSYWYLEATSTVPDSS
jgi:integrase/recombinase XerD